jgi:hypothetical protein
MHVHALYALSSIVQTDVQHKRDKTPPDSAVPASLFERFL